MDGFFTALGQYPFLQNALIAGLLAAVACGLAGTFVVLKKISFVTGGISHAVLGGVGVAVFLGYSPFAGALVCALLFTVVLGLVNKRARQHEDTLIGALWAVGMSVGILFLYLTPGHQADLMGYLFGSILMVPRESLYRLAALDAVVLVTVFVFFRQFIAISFDEEHARVRGLPRTALYIILLGVVALTVVVLMQAVGLILVIALLTLPAATAALFSRSPAAIVGWATLIGVFSTFAGIFGSFTLDIPAGPAMVLTAGAFYLAGLVLRAVSGRSA